jgi:hypothetical protein
VSSLIPESDHVVRFCNALCIEDGEIQASAFQLKDNEQYLSCNWVECLKKDSKREAAQEILKAYDRKGFKVNRKKGHFAVLNVGNTKSLVKAQRCDLSGIEFLHIGKDSDPSYSGIYHLENYNAEEIGELICQSIIESIPIREL